MADRRRHRQGADAILDRVDYVGDLGLFAWDAIIEVARHDVVEAEELDIRVDPKRDASAVRQREAAVDRDTGEGTVAAHTRAPEGGGKDYSRLSNLPKAARAG